MLHTRSIRIAGHLFQHSTSPVAHHTRGHKASAVQFEGALRLGISSPDPCCQRNCIRSWHRKLQLQCAAASGAADASFEFANNVVSLPGGTLFDLAELTQGLPAIAFATVLNGRTAAAREQLVAWAEQLGAQVLVRVGHAAFGGPCGLLATRDIRHGDVILSMPSHLALDFGSSPEEGAVALLDLLQSECAVDLAPWAACLPKPGSQMEWESLTDEQLGWLQCPELAAAVVARRARLQAVWEKDSEAKAVQGQQPFTWRQVQWAATTLRSRQSVIDQPMDGGVRLPIMPLMDMVNHDATSHNVLFRSADTWQLVHMGNGIKKGAEVTWSYEGECGCPLRNDQAALDYGFLIPQSDQESRLFYVDLPNYRAGSLAAAQEFCPSALARYNDQAPLFPGRKEAQAENDRLQRQLQSLPTTEAYDRWLLSTPGMAEARSERFLINVRLMRKRALRHAIDNVLEALDSFELPLARGAVRNASGYCVQAAARQ